MSDLSRLLADELALLREFVALLGREQQALIPGDIDRLLPLAEEKTRLATVLGRMAGARNQALAGAGLAADKAGMEAWLTSQGQATPSRADWAALLALAAEAKLQNEINGKLIATRLQHNRHALAVLHAAADQAMLYGPDGQPHATGSGRHLGAA